MHTYLPCASCTLALGRFATYLPFLNNVVFMANKRLTKTGEYIYCFATVLLNFKTCSLFHLRIVTFYFRAVQVAVSTSES